MRFRYFLASLLLALLFAGEASARGTLDSILPEIRSAHPGRLSDAEPWTDSDGNTHYRIKWMTPEGRILYFNADAESGRFSSGGDDGQSTGGGRRWDRGGRDDEQGPSDNDGGARRSHWNGDGGGGDWHARHDNGGGEWNGGGGRDWHERHGGDNGGRGDHGGWRGGHGGDNGGRHSRGNDN